MAKTTQIALRVPNDLLAKLRCVAQSEDRTVSNLLNRIIRLYLTSSDDGSRYVTHRDVEESERC